MSGLLGDFLRSEKQRGLFDEEYQRGGLVPLAINPFTGRAEMAMPQFLGGLLEAFKAPGDVLAGERQPSLGDALGVAGMAVGGWLPKNPAAAGVSDGIRAYMVDPNYLKTVAPGVAERIREYVNSNPRINKHIQFNASGLPIGLGQPTE